MRKLNQSIGQLPKFLPDQDTLFSYPQNLISTHYRDRGHGRLGWVCGDRGLVEMSVGRRLLVELLAVGLLAVGVGLPVVGLDRHVEAWGFPVLLVGFHC